MRFIALSLFMVATLGLVATSPAHMAQADLFSSFKGKSSNAKPGSFADLAERLLPAVVNISSTQKFDENADGPMQEMPQFPPGSPFEDFFEDFFEGPPGGGHGMPAIPPASLGSGFVIDADEGFIITNNHVVRDADEVLITFHDDETIEAEVIGRDEKTDIAVLKVDTDKELIEVPLGDSDDMRVGDWVLAIGNPFGLGGTVTAGIVSARQRDINSGPYDDYIQTDASINRGNSGGPMFNLNGEVIGINTAIFSPSGGSVGIGFAIPSSLAESVIDQIIEFGRTRRGWLGVKIQTVTEEIAESLGLGEEQGALVADVTEGGPAEKAGMKAGDVILEFNGKPVEEMRNLPRMVAETAIGSTANVTFWRDNRRQKITVEIGELEKAEEEGLIENASTETPEQDEDAKGFELEEMGLTLARISDDDREKYSIDRELKGLLVTDVARNSDAARKGIVSGDVIVEINQTQVSTPSDAREIVDSAIEQGRGSVLLLLNQAGDVRFTGIKLKDAE
ncbi:MAG: DegQ family serine endoprotease [Pseudomonadota bacterium]